MDLDNIKNIWKEQDSKLNKSMEIDSEVLKNTIKQSSNGVRENFIKWTYFSLFVFFVFFLLMLVGTYSAAFDWRFLISGIFASSFFIVCMFIVIKGIQKLKAINLFSKSIMETKEALLTYRSHEIKFKKTFSYCIPPVIVSFLLVGVNFVRGINLLDYPVLFGVLATSIIVLSYVLLPLLHKTHFLRKMEEIQESLEELEKFKK
jgi:hypothetical protein